MIRTLTLLCLVAAPVFGRKPWPGGLRVRYDVNPLTYRTKSFMEVPQSVAEATDAYWVQKTGPKTPAGYEGLSLYGPRTDNTVCAWIDDTGYVAGLLISFDEEQFTDSIYDWEVQGFTRWTTDLGGVPKNYWSGQIYFITPQLLATNPAERIAARNSNLLLQDKYIVVSGINGELHRIPTNVSEIANPNSNFTKQGCFLSMGQHYYYKMTEDLECKAETMFPWFPLTDSDQLIGIGFTAFGKYTTENGKTEWFEHPPRLAVKTIVPRGPSCLYDLANNPGLVTIHIYFINTPYRVGCLF